MVSQEDMPLQTVSDAAGDRMAAIETGFGEEHCEFITAKPCNHVRFTGAAANDLGGFDQGTAAEQVSVDVVNLLEPVQVNKEEGKGPAAAHGALGFLTESVVQIP
jgi:hypothetical protein